MPSAAVKKRMVVPLFSTNNSAFVIGSAPEQPKTVSSLAFSDLEISTPNFFRQSIITRVSSLSSAPVSDDVPSASAAHNNARLVILFEPGGQIEKSTGPVAGWIWMKGWCLWSTVTCSLNVNSIQLKMANQ